MFFKHYSSYTEISIMAGVFMGYRLAINETPYGDLARGFLEHRLIDL